MEIKFFGGVNEIGGNRILVQDGSTSLFLDYGMSFARHQRFFEEYLKPRYASTGIKDLLRLNLIHYIPGLYRSDLLNLIGKPPHTTPSVDGVVLSHIHLDHSALISLLDEHIPIICSQITKSYAEAILDVGTRSLETEICNFKRRPLIDRNEAPVKRDFNVFESGVEKEVGEISIVPYYVDHSVLGAASYIVKASAFTILYTGDLRCNSGPDSQTERFIEAAAKADVDVMLCEGTRIGETESASEEYVRERAIKTIQDSEGLVIADFAFRDLSRLATFTAVAKETGRKLVISKRDACLLESIGKCSDLSLNLPSHDDKNIRVYIDRKKTGRYLKGDYRGPEKPYVQASNAIRADEVHSEQEDLLIHLTFWDINELVDINPSPGATYIHSSSEPHNEEQIIDQVRLDNWLNHFKLKKYHYHCSGHASGLEIKEIIERVKPKTLMPIHTMEPHLFEGLHRNVKMPTLEPF